MYARLPQQTKSQKIKAGLRIGIQTSTVLIACWVIWSLNVYKYSNDRLGSLMLNKYQIAHPTKPNKDTYYNFSNVQFNKNDMTATCTIENRNKITQKALTSVNVKYNLTNDCTAEDLFCIKV